MEKLTVSQFPEEDAVEINVGRLQLASPLDQIPRDFTHSKLSLFYIDSHVFDNYVQELDTPLIRGVASYGELQQRRIPRLQNYNYHFGLNLSSFLLSEWYDHLNAIPPSIQESSFFTVRRIVRGSDLRLAYQQAYALLGRQIPALDMIVPSVQPRFLTGDGFAQVAGIVDGILVINLTQQRYNAKHGIRYNVVNE